MSYAWRSRGPSVAVHRDAVEAARSADPDEQYNVGTRLVELLERESRLIVVDDGDEVARNVRVRTAPGHRVGHVCLHIDDSDPFVHAADTFHHLVHARTPSGIPRRTSSRSSRRRRGASESSPSWPRTMRGRSSRTCKGPYAFRISSDGDRFTSVTTRP